MTGLYIAIGVSVLFIGYTIYGYRKMQNMKDVPPSKKIRILNNKNFKQVIRKETVLVDFWAPWCAPCKVLAPTLNDLAEEDNNNCTIAKVNVEQHQQLAKKYNVRSIPTLILFSEGNEVKRFTGVKSKSFLKKECKLA